MDFLKIVLTVVFVVVVASIVGFFVRRFRLRSWHLGLMMAIGFILLISAGSGGSTALQITAIVLLGFSGAGFFYMFFMGGSKKQKLEQQGGGKEQSDATNTSNGEPPTETWGHSKSPPKEQKKLF